MKYGPHNKHRSHTDKFIEGANKFVRGTAKSSVSAVKKLERGRQDLRAVLGRNGRIKLHEAQKWKKSGTNTSDIHSGLQSSKWSIPASRKLPKSVKGAVMIMSENRSAITTSVAGAQGVLAVYVSGTPSQWVSPASGTSVAPSIRQSEIPYFDMNPNRFTTGSGKLPATVPLDDRLCLLSQETIIDVSNFTSLATNLEMYVFRCTNNTDFDPVYLWNQQITADAYSVTPYGAPLAGTQFPSTFGASSSATPYMQPKGPLIRGFYKMIGKKQLYLAGGASESVKLNIGHNWVAKEQAIISNANAYCPGSVVIVFRQLGMVAADQTVTARLATHGISKIGAVFNTRYFFKGVYGNGARLRSQLAWGIEPYGATVANLVQIDSKDVPIQEAEL